jgi:ribonuclease Z
MIQVPLGPLLGQLKKGQAVTLPCGKVVRADECVSPSEVFYMYTYIYTYIDIYLYIYIYIYIYIYKYV